MELNGILNCPRAHVKSSNVPDWIADWGPKVLNFKVASGTHKNHARGTKGNVKNQSVKEDK